ncbi:YbaK/EbsC family protein [Kutzneria sp. NPDC052558]|uniref:YbaK/EbsC family protein n=1 Tax=Kutzneria sp. NPDC052558 TaxID=3364121 RepID=UPI0037C5FBB1
MLHLLDLHGVPYRVLRHSPVGNTERASRVRGHEVRSAAKCMITEVRGVDRPRFVLAVVEGHRRVDFKAIKRLYGRHDATLAPPDLAERYGRGVVGSIPPFTFDADLDLLVDVRLLDHEMIYFNAARLDRSIALAVRDYLFVANARLARISRPACES